jgi:hypothetical protein
LNTCWSISGWVMAVIRVLRVVVGDASRNE